MLGLQRPNLFCYSCSVGAMFLAKKRPAASVDGLFSLMSFGDYKSSVSENWFVSPTTLALHALGPRLVCEDGLSDTVALRGVLVCQSLGLCPIPKHCPENKKHKLKLCEEWNSKDGLRFRLKCAEFGHKCHRSRLCCAGLLSKVHVSSWMAFVYFCNCMRLNYRWTKVMSDIESVFGIKNKRTFQSWRSLYQNALIQYLARKGSMVIGTSPGDVVVFDETNIGSMRGISKSSSTDRASSRSKPVVRKKILKRLPARTIHKRPAMRRPAAVSSTAPSGARPLRRPAAAMKSVFNQGKKGTSKDTRSGGRWLFAAVLVGHKKERYTHANGKKRFTFKLLPKPALAPSQKPRGKVSMERALAACISKKAFLVHDAWTASTAAIKSMGYKAAPPVNHSVGWRDNSTGFHSNDIESEFSRLKNLVRERYGRLSFQATLGTSEPEEDEELDLGDLYEYAFRVNVGSSFEDVRRALQVVSPV